MPTDLLAAGAVALRGEGADREVLVVHRPAYDDWTLPKGKPDGGEPLPVAAVREFAEETGYVPDGLSQPLGVLSYAVGAATKQVSWWLARLDAAAAPRPVAHPAEVDEVRWLPLSGVRSRLTYADEADLVERAAAVGRPSVPFVVVRHAKAMDRFEWPAGVPDVKRPLAPRGARQAEALAGLLGAYGVRRVASSAAVRCLGTVTPYAQGAGLPVEAVEALTAESAWARPHLVDKAMDRLRRQALAERVAVAVCGHNPVLEDMIARLGAEPPMVIKPAQACVVHLHPDTGACLAAETYRSAI